MTERNGKWSGLSEADRAQVLAKLEADPSIVAQFVFAAETGDTLATEALLAFGVDTIVVQDSNHPEDTQTF